jgi:hypothetical protein
MEPTTRATPRAHTNRERPVVTRHGLQSSHAATPPLQRMRQYARFAKISATALNMSRGQLPIHAPPGKKSHLPSSRGRVPESGVGAVGKWPAVATVQSLAEAGHLSTAVVIACLR